MDQTYKKIGTKIRSLRKIGGCSQQGLAEVIGVTFQQVQKYERGENRIPINKLKALAEYFNSPVSYFIEEDCESGSDMQNSSFDQAQLDTLAKHFFAIEDEGIRKNLLYLMKSMSNN